MYKRQPHNSAKKGDFARTVLMPGDPLRAKFIAETFLDEPKLVNNVRGVQGYTGTYKGVPVSEMCIRDRVYGPEPMGVEVTDLTWDRSPLTKPNMLLS